MCQNQHDSFSECGLSDEELAHTLEPLLRDMPKLRECLNMDALRETVLSKMGIKPLGIVGGTPESKHHFFWCELCSRVFEYVERDEDEGFRQ